MLRAWGAGDREAFDRLVPLVYGELHRIAGRCMQHEHAGITLQTTALVNEAYLRLVDVNGVSWEERAHFFAISAQMMRRIMVDAARARGSRKRGGGTLRLNLIDSIAASPDQGNQLVQLDDALTALAEFDPRKAKVVEMRFFGGLSVEETAKVLRISPQSVMRDWKLARAWLTRELSQ